MTDPIRFLLARDAETKRARADNDYVQALMDGQAPSAAAYVAALDAGYTGDEALTAARNIDRAAANFTPPAA